MVKIVIPEDLSIPDFLKVENRGPASPDLSTQKAPGVTPELPLTPEQKIINSMSPKAQALVKELIATGRMQRHWLLEPGRVESYENQVKAHDEKKAQRVAFLRTLPKKEKVAKPKFGAGTKIKVLHANPRAAGTGAAERYAVMVKWIDKYPNGTVEELLAQTKYGKNDLKWDIAHGNIQTYI